MQWEAGPSAGFTTGKPWLRANPDAAAINVQRELADSGSLLSYYRRLIALRKATPALRRGSYRPLFNSPGRLMAYLREHEGQRVAVCLNFGSRLGVFDLGAAGDGEWHVLISTEAGRAGNLGGDVALAPNEALLLRHIA